MHLLSDIDIENIFPLSFSGVFLNTFNFFEREREREREHQQGRGRERGRHSIPNRLQAPSCQHRAPTPPLPVIFLSIFCEQNFFLYIHMYLLSVCSLIFCALCSVPKNCIYPKTKKSFPSLLVCVIYFSILCLTL